jgi:uncharacterized membrane protein YcaP (DUF421 family)
MEIVLRAVVTFFFLLLVIRGMGKKELSQLTAFELIVLITMGDLVQQGVTQEDQSLTGAFTAVGVFVLLVVALSAVQFRSSRARGVIRGMPVVVVRDGRPLEDVMRLERLKLDEITEGAREQGIGDLADVKIAVLEPDGKLSFIQNGGGDQQGSRDKSIS